MTKREAIRECKRLWKEIVASGLGKDQFLVTKAGKKWRDKCYDSDCPLCEYKNSKPYRDDDCETYCPLILQYGKDCFELRYLGDPAGFYEYVKGLKE